LRILVSGVNYAPEVTGIAPYTSGLAEYLAAQGHEVIVATTFPFAPHWRWFEEPPRWRTREQRNGVEVWRTKIVLPPRRTSAWRITFDTSIGLTSALTALSIPKVDVAICVSPPIQTALAAAAVRFKVGKLVVFVQDLPTEAARSVGMLKDGVALRVGRSLEHLAYKLADHIVVISSAFATYIESVGVEASKISEIPNWADVEAIKPARQDQAMRNRLGAGPGDFLVVYTGNMGAKQDLLNVVAAANMLSEDKRVKIALIGDGQERVRVAENIEARRLENIRLLPLQASHEFSKVLTAADALIINQGAGVVDSVLPSKLLSYMASGRPVVAAVHPDSTTADLVRRSGCGVVVDPGNPEALAAELRALASNNGESKNLALIGSRGRAYVERNFDRSGILHRWDVLLGGLVPAETTHK
jgi:glycosyltransferase involved in cell wall biosynthesis